MAVIRMHGVCMYISMCLYMHECVYICEFVSVFTCIFEWGGGGGGGVPEGDPMAFDNCVNKTLLA